MADAEHIHPLRVFISYSHKDEPFKDELEIHLKILQRQGLIESWHDRMIVAGKEWESEIDNNLEQADIILLLVSAYFIASDYCYQKEMSVSMRRHEAGEAVVIPIFIRPCDWEDAPFEKLQGLPKNAKPVTSWGDPQEAWTDIANSLRKTIRSFSASRKPIRTDETLSKKKPRVISIEEYLNGLVQNYESVSWTKRAVIMNAKENDKELPVDDMLFKWVQNDASSFAFLIGEFGSGKTWTLKKLARNLAKSYLSGDHAKLVPVFIPLVKILGSSASPKPMELPFLPSTSDSSNKYLFLFDGLDEVSFQATDNVAHMLRRLTEKAPPNSRFVISCRTQAFSAMKSLLELDFDTGSALIEDKTDWAIQSTFSRPIVYELARISNTKAEQFLSRGPAGKYWEDLKNKKTYYKIIGQPVVLALLERALPELTSYGSPVTVAEIYRLAIEIWIKRDSYCNRLDLSQEIWRKTLADLAGLMFPGGVSDLKRVNAHLTLQSNWNPMMNALINAEILELNNFGSLRFSHQSLWEFFFAIKVHQQLQEYNAELLAQSNLVYQYATNCFLIPLLKQETILVHTTSNLDKSLLQTALPINGGMISKPITRSQYRQFTFESGWRKTSGYGMWGTFDTPDGTPAITGEESSLKGVGETPFLENSFKAVSDQVISRISWYDAWQFCRWVGGVVPSLSTIKQDKRISNLSIEFEWSQDWYDEQSALIAVHDTKSNKTMGVNPDLRAENLGFRVFFPNDQVTQILINNYRVR